MGGWNNSGNLGTLFGTGIGAALAIPTGGMSIPAGAALGGSIGGSAGNAAGVAFGRDVQNANQMPDVRTGPQAHPVAMQLLQGLQQQQQQQMQQQQQAILALLMQAAQPQMTATIGQPTVVGGPNAR